MNQGLKNRLKNFVRSAGNVMIRRSLATFFVLLLLLLALILLGHFLRQPVTDKSTKTAEKKEATLFIPSQNTALVTVPAEIKKERVVTLAALSPGIVSAIYTAPGRRVAPGQTILEITNDYSSGRAGLSVRLAEEERALTLELAGIDKKIFTLEDRRIKRDNTLSSLEEEIELRRLKKDRETRSSDLETSRLELEIARKSDAALKPKSFSSGRVESIAVKRGDYVTPGTPLATLTADQGTLTLEALVSREIAFLVDPERSALIEHAGQTSEVSPLYLSQTENADGLFSLLYTLPQTLDASFTDGSFVKVELPLRSLNPETVLVPVDTLFQDTARAWVMIEVDGKVVSQEVRLGHLYGSFAEVSGGLTKDSHIILNRSVIAGDLVTVR